MTERSAKSRWDSAESSGAPVSAEVPAARSSSTELARSITAPQLERRRRAPALAPVLPLPREEHRSWDRARWVNEVRRFDTAWDVDAPRSTRELRPLSVDESKAAEQVTLIVYEWQNAEPGTLSWQFTDSKAAVTAARAMRNAVRWAVVAGDETNLAAARANGRVLAEGDES